MLDFDQEINCFVRANNGFYRRYSDDFIVVLPYTDVKTMNKQYKFLLAKIKDVKELVLENRKTQVFEIKDSIVTNCNAKYVVDGKQKLNRIDYLGFSFDGEKVTIRDKTVGKFYHRLYAKIKTVCVNNGISKKGKIISCANIYKKYSIKGAFKVEKDGHKKNNNFLGYVGMAEKVFENEPAIARIRKVNMAKIKNRLNKGLRSGKT